MYDAAEALLLLGLVAMKIGNLQRGGTFQTGQSANTANELRRQRRAIRHVSELPRPRTRVYALKERRIICGAASRLGGGGQHGGPHFLRSKAVLCAADADARQKLFRAPFRAHRLYCKKCPTGSLEQFAAWRPPLKRFAEHSRSTN